MATSPESNEPVATPDADAAKERFRQALEAKNAKGKKSSGGGAQDAKGTTGSSARVGGQREFRRKSG